MLADPCLGHCAECGVLTLATRPREANQLLVCSRVCWVSQGEDYYALHGWPAELRCEECAAELYPKHNIGQYAKALVCGPDCLRKWIADQELTGLNPYPLVPWLWGDQGLRALDLPAAERAVAWFRGEDTRMVFGRYIDIHRALVTLPPDRSSEVLREILGS